MKLRLAAARRYPIALLTAAGVFTAIAVFDLIAHPADQHALQTYKEYVLTATIFPGVASLAWVLAALDSVHANHRDHFAGTSLRVAAIGLLGLVVDAIVTLASGTTDTVGPLYPVAMLVTLVGVVLMAFGWHRARELPRWIGPALAVAWLLGATPIIGGGAMLILAAAFLVIAAGLHRQALARLAVPVRVDSSATA